MESWKRLCELIDTLWNVNERHVFMGNTYFWINRYIMECKSINRRTKKSKSEELIDTLWNVNCLALEICKFWWYELIDTLWNVNQ